MRGWFVVMLCATVMIGVWKDTELGLHKHGIQQHTGDLFVHIAFVVAEQKLVVVVAVAVEQLERVGLVAFCCVGEVLR